MNKVALLLPSLLITACGADVAGTATTAATLSATSAQQAKAQEALVKGKLDAAMQATEAAARAPAEK